PRFDTARHIQLAIASCASLSPLCFLNDPAPTEIYSLSLHDALPIYGPKRFCDSQDLHLVVGGGRLPSRRPAVVRHIPCPPAGPGDRKSTRLNSSHVKISYAVFCLKKKKHSTRT